MHSLAIYIITDSSKMNYHFIPRIQIQDISSVSSDLRSVLQLLVKYKAVRGVPCTALTVRAFVASKEQEWSPIWTKRLLDEVKTNNLMRDTPAEYFLISHLEPTSRNPKPNEYILEQLADNLNLPAPLFSKI